MSQQPHPPVDATPDRRTFLTGVAALGLAGGVLGSLARSAGAAPWQPRLDGAGIQLFTVRDRLAADFEGTLAKLAEIGYRQVEFFTYADRTPAQVRAAPDAAGLGAPSTHVVLRPGPNLERELAGQHRGRFPLSHVKDMAELTVVRSHPTMRERQRAARIVPLGQGSIHYAPIFARASVAGLRHYFVEQDTAPASGDSLAAARTSFDALRRLLA